jgi:hypothetical protein
VSEIKITSDYNKFKFREDNREAINQSHINRLANSIKARNLLELRPISVNAEMEVIDGQHRLLAAKILGVPIYYIQTHDLTSNDIILMNVAQTWGQADYLNYYCKNNYHEYIKLKNFMADNRLSLKIAINITVGAARDTYIKFKEGKFTFNKEHFDSYINNCWETIEYIKRMNGYSGYTDSARFWGALLILIRHENFDAAKWMDNLSKMVGRITAKASKEDYLKMFLEIHNWRNNSKVELL